MENLEIWNKVEKTNPKFTKETNLGGRKVTSINPTFQIKNATEVFGMYGKGFGLENLKHEFKEFGSTTLLILHCDFFYFLEEKKYNFPLSGSIKMAYVSSKGNQILDDDAFKKIETDLTTKALSKLGFNADIFMGKYDDVKYIKDIVDSFKGEEIERIKAEIEASKTVEGLKKIYNDNIDIVCENPLLSDLLTKKKNQIESK